MKFIDYSSGQFRDVPVAEYIGRLKDGGIPSGLKKEITGIELEGTAAQGRIKIESGKMVIYDFMNLLKDNGEWKIVSKIFYRHTK